MPSDGMVTMPVSNQQTAADLLQRHGIRPTSQRLEIVILLLEKYQHLSAEQVLDRLQQRGAKVSKATVYNTLKRFAECGIVREVVVDPKRIFYDSNTAIHYHFYNMDDHTLIDLDPGAIHISNLSALPAGTVKASVDVVVRICNSTYKTC